MHVNIEMQMSSKDWFKFSSVRKVPIGGRRKSKHGFIFWTFLMHVMVSNIQADHYYVHRGGKEAKDEPCP